MNPLHHPYFVKFIVYFNENQDFFECHEVLEDYWKSSPNRTKEHPLVAYILLATSLYHWRRDNTVGAKRSITKANDKFKIMLNLYPNYTGSINFNKLLEDIDKSIARMTTGQTFKPFTIEVICPKLKRKITDMLPTLDLLPLGSDAVIHKHMLRDRSDIHKPK